MNLIFPALMKQVSPFSLVKPQEPEVQSGWNHTRYDRVQLWTSRMESTKKNQHKTQHSTVSKALCPVKCKGSEGWMSDFLQSCLLHYHS